MCIANNEESREASLLYMSHKTYAALNVLALARYNSQRPQ